MSLYTVDKTIRRTFVDLGNMMVFHIWTLWKSGIWLIISGIYVTTILECRSCCLLLSYTGSYLTAHACIDFLKIRQQRFTMVMSPFIMGMSSDNCWTVKRYQWNILPSTVKGKFWYKNNFRLNHDLDNYKDIVQFSLQDSSL